MRRLTAPALLLALAACTPLSLALREESPRGVLYPQVSRVQGEARLKPRHAREASPLRGPTILEPGDWLETGPDGKVEVLLPSAAVRLYGGTRAQVLFSFQERTAVARDLEVAEGELLVRTLTAAPFTVRTYGLEVESRGPSAFLVGVRTPAHMAACYAGAAEARNTRVRGQTIVKLAPGHHLALDDGPLTATLQPAKLPDEWRRWERPDAFSSGLLAPAPAGQPVSAQ